MKITNLHIENFRSIKSLDVKLDDTTVFIGSNNSGKSAILEAVRIALSRRWGQKGTGFTEDDVHIPGEDMDPRVAPAVKISFEFIEPSANEWPSDMVSNLEDIMTITPQGLNKVAVWITYRWNSDKEIFEPSWEFLNSAGEPLPPRKRSINLSAFYDYVLFFWLGALRDVNDEFSSRSHNWGGLLRAVKVPPALQDEIKKELDELDSKLLSADPKLSEIAETIGGATEIAIEETPGSAKLRMLPMNVWDILSRAGIVLRNGDQRPWLPLDHHGQGLQSLSIIFLFQAAVAQQLSDGLYEGAEPIFAIEEPEAHLHPQAVRTLWNRISEMSGQKLVTSHSPYFIQNVPLKDLRIVRLKEGTTSVASLRQSVISDLPWTEEVENFITGRGLKQFIKDEDSCNIVALENFNEQIAEDLANCWRGKENASDMKVNVKKLRHDCRILISKDDETELTILGRRFRGEIFFANRWVMVEGQSDHMLLTALGYSNGYILDQHGVAVIDFKNNGNAGIYAALAEAFEIPWCMLTDGDGESDRFKKELLKRGFNEADLSKHFCTLQSPNDLEDQLIADGHEELLRKIMAGISSSRVEQLPLNDFKKLLKKNKTAYMARLVSMIMVDADLASKMPKEFISVIERLKNNNL